jgi:predicted amidohydrolase YtcJ
VFKLFKLLFPVVLILIISCEKNTMILYTNCNVYERPDIKAILCNKGKIIQLLPSGNINSGKRIDLKGGWVYPGFIDSHMHLTGLGWSLESVDLVGTTSKLDALKKIKEGIKNTPKGTWVLGRGWDQNDWSKSEYPKATDLDLISMDHPMIFRRIDGHAAWANTLAMKLANISENTVDVNGGIIIRDDIGYPTGIFIDNALDLIESQIPEKTEQDIYRQIIKAQTMLNKFGITSIHDAGTSKKEIKILKKMIKNEELSIRVYTMLNNNPKDYDSFLESGPEIENPFIKVQSIKIYLDGALGSRGAALLEPYSDSPSENGLLIIKPSEHKSLVKKFSKSGFQVNTHGIGDRAIRIILDNYEEVANTKIRNRIEHSQIVHPDDVPRFKELNVIPAMQSTHCTSDMPWVEERIGLERMHEAYPWKSFIKLNIPVPGGSDAPIESPNPIEGIYASVTRKDKNGLPEKGWYSEQKMTLKEAIKSYTEWGAYASYEEKIKGKIKENFYADFTVLDQELKSTNLEMILDTRVLFTILNGKIVYQSNEQ